MENEHLNAHPSIIFNTIPKSGSVYITQSMQNGLGYAFMPISNGYLPHDSIIVHNFITFLNNESTITQEHLDASEFNKQQLKEYTDKIVVHFRDPRAVLLSWTHHMNDLNRCGHFNALDYVTPTPPRSYYTLSFEQQIDWQIDNFLPNIIQWMQEWLEFEEQESRNQNGFKILFTTYDEFLSDEIGFYYKILDFYNIPREEFTFNPAQKSSENHFRSGKIDEWRSVFTAQQIHKISTLIPENILNIFEPNNLLTIKNTQIITSPCP